MTIYCLVLLAANIISIFFFHENIHISALSIVPMALIGVSVFQAVYFHNYRTKKDFNTNNNSPLTEREWADMTLYLRNSLIICIPLFIPLIVFFDWYIKIISLPLYFVGFSGGSIYYKIKIKIHLMIDLQMKLKN